MVGKFRQALRRWLTMPQTRIVITQPGLYICEFQERFLRFRYRTNRRIVDTSLDGLMVQVARFESMMLRSKGMGESRQVRRRKARKMARAMAR